MKGLNWNRGLFRFLTLLSSVWLVLLGVENRPDQDVYTIWLFSDVGVVQEMPLEDDIADGNEGPDLRTMALIEAKRRYDEAWRSLKIFIGRLIFPLIGLAILSFGLVWAIRGFSPKAQNSK